MTNAESPMRQYNMLNFILSLQCNIQCEHCLYECTPASSAQMAMDQSQLFLAQAAQAGISTVGLSGGEPFLFFDQALEWVKQAHSLDLNCLASTNAFWGRTRLSADSKVRALKQAGLNSLMISTDRFHLNFIPVDYVINVLNAGNAQHLPMSVKIARFHDDSSADRLMNQIRPLAAPVKFQAIAPLGRGANWRSQTTLHHIDELPVCGCHAPPALLPNGRLLACCNLPAARMSDRHYPFVLGEKGSPALAALLHQRQNHPLLKLVRRFGPKIFFLCLKKNHPEILANHPKQFHNLCDLCTYVITRTGALEFLTQHTCLLMALAPQLMRKGDCHVY